MSVKTSRLAGNFHEHGTLLIQDVSKTKKAAGRFMANRLIFFGGSWADRTPDSLLKRQILYLLS